MANLGRTKREDRANPMGGKTTLRARGLGRVAAVIIVAGALIGVATGAADRAPGPAASASDLPVEAVATSSTIAQPTIQASSWFMAPLPEPDQYAGVTLSATQTTPLRASVSMVASPR